MDKNKLFPCSRKGRIGTTVKKSEEKYTEKEKENKKTIQEYDEEVSNLLHANKEVHKSVGYVLEFLKAKRKEQGY